MKTVDEAVCAFRGTYLYPWFSSQEGIFSWDRGMSCYAPYPSVGLV